MTLAGIVLALWLAGTGYADSFTCTVTGYIYTMPGESPDFKRSDGCQMIQHRLEDRDIVLWTTRYWVRVTLPDTHEGQMTFWYRWGAKIAFIDAKEWVVSWGTYTVG